MKEDLNQDPGLMDEVQLQQPQMMSRGMEPEIIIPYDELKELEVEDENGVKIKFGNLYSNQKTIIVFVRHFLCYMCKEYVDDLATIPMKSLEETNTRLVVIGCAPSKFIEPFKKATGYKFDMYCDPDRLLYKKMGCKENGSPGEVKGSKHVKSGPISGVFKSTWRGMKFREYQGEVKQQGASLVMGPGDVVHLAHLDKESTDHRPINDLLEAAGVPTISFPLDKRVMHV